MRHLHKVLTGGVALALLLVPALLLLLPGGAESSEQEMTKLPAYNKFKCQNCHVSAQPTAQASELNGFGRDFQANGLVWDEKLALMNSDGDRCSNGFELGDPDGDGLYDNGANVVEHSNPGDGTDCTIALNQSTWSVIKDIFSKEIQPYEGGFEEDFSLYFP